MLVQTFSSLFMQPLSPLFLLSLYHSHSIVHGLGGHLFIVPLFLVLHLAPPLFFTIKGWPFSEIT